ncbi:MAG TPA: M14 family metallopeptidase, partial [Flavobacteriaceae bacterium]|nr:M14 family metallopeptidase [Flavobacteriaceae bacterium]
MKKIFALLTLCLFCCNKKEGKLYNFETIFEASNGTETATYQQTISFYQNLAKTYPEVSIQEIGETDSGKPLYLVTLNPDGVFDFSEIRENKGILLINNGIHPGESDGIDATMMLFRDIAQDSIELPKKTVLVTIPIYNVGGSLNRNSTTRANQNGPEEYGFRGNARNYDLNRDFIKCDTKNARTFTRIYHLVQPDIFIDNHVSNGADYQYTLTHVFTQHNKLGGKLGEFLYAQIMPSLKQKLSKKEWSISPYVNVFNQVPEKGFSQFIDYPRYSTGYTTLFNTFGMMVETHMLKPYKQRVYGTYELMKSMLEITEERGEVIASLRENALKRFKTGDNYVLDWEVDTTKASTLYFKGFEGNTIESEVTGFKRLQYDRSKPFTKKVAYQDYLKPKIEVKIPSAYIVPKSWFDVIERLELNQVEIQPLKKDTTITVEAYKIDNYKTRSNPYEGHYQHYNTNITRTSKEVTFTAGDYIIPTDQKALRYLIETLEPQAPDSFFNWNFFDTILQQKEGFSPYVWEDKAKELLDNDPELKLLFETKKYTDTAFANNWYAQLDWIFKKSV